MSRVFEELLRVRDLGEGFLCPKYEDCITPWALPDMREVVERLKLARECGEKIIIYGDYDVDGVTASTVMYDLLGLIGIAKENVEIMLPNRFLDGYGMSKKVVQRAVETGVKLVITVDCGSRNHEVIEELGEKKIDVIVTDHHECGETLPRAVAVVNPKRRDVVEDDRMKELRELCGAGVAFKVAQACMEEGMLPVGQEKWLLDLVLIGTICDSMVIRGENRRLCYYGVKVLEKTRRAGLKELMRVAGVKKLGSGAIGFQIGPRLNAAGRMETAEKALGLLMAKTRMTATSLALELESLNSQRKDQQNMAVREIGERGVGGDKVIVVAGEWHEGVLGIIAGRLVEEYRRPAFVLAEVDGVYKGSGRSFGDFNLAEALMVCDSYIVGGGGHAQACGIKIEKIKLEDFRRAVNEYYQSLKLEGQERFLDVREDIVVDDFAELSLELLEELRRLEPFGPGNEEPVFLLSNVRVAEASKMGEEGRHLRLVVWDKNGRNLKLVKFGAPEEYLNIKSGEVANIWVQLEENEFRGLRSVEGRILKIR